MAACRWCSSMERPSLLPCDTPTASRSTPRIGRLQDLATVLLCVQLTVAGLCLSGPVFNTQLGIQFWAVAGALAGAAGVRSCVKGRAQRLLGGLGLGYLHTAGVVLVGLWLTPFLLRQLGSHDYGLWLLGTQVVFYLGLMDLGHRCAGTP